MFRHILPFLFIVAANATEFSVYLTPPELTENGKALATVGDLHIDVNGKAIPMELVEGRQSITYPCAAGASVEFFRVAKDEKQTRTPVASAVVPATATQGLLVVSPAASGDYKIIPFWFTSSEAKKGCGIFVNLSGRPLGLACNGKRTKLLPQSRWIVQGQFDSSQMLAATRVEIFGQTDAESPEITRLLDRHVGLPKDDTGIYIILPKEENYITLLSLEVGGLRDPVSKETLKKRLTPAPTAAAVPAPVS
jgi:hypothetical protein